MKEVKRFWGLHFDFHARDEAIGTRTCEEDIERYVLEAKPDFIQCDSKGHAGNCSWPTNVKEGKAADNIVSDNLRVWSNVAKKYNIPLFVHYSGVWDTEYGKAHPEEQAKYDANMAHVGAVMLEGKYLDDVLIPQMKELREEYGIAGVWIDGDCWAVAPDFSEKGKQIYGITEDMPKRQLNQIMHDAYLRYLQKYVDELHNYDPDFKVISNWAYTTYIPDKPTVNVDFLSGDYLHNNSVHEARYEARGLALRDIPWDLMAWGFEATRYADKSDIQLMQEAVMTLSMGGGFQVYTMQNRDGSARRKNFPNFSTLAKFMREREFLYGRKPIAQVAVLYDSESFYCQSNVFNAAGGTNSIIGTINAVIDAQYTANILYNYQAALFRDYEIVIVPQWENIASDTKEALFQYVREGGRLLVIGVEASRQFAQMFNVSTGEVKKLNNASIKDKSGAFASIEKKPYNQDFITEVLDLKEGQEHIYEGYDLRDESIVAYRIEDYGKGKVGFIPFNLGTSYREVQTFAMRNFLFEIMKEMSPPNITLNRKHIDITLQPSEKGVYCNLINMLQGRHSLSYGVYEDIPEIYDIELRYNKKCEDVKMPLGEAFEWELRDNETIVYLKKLEIHSVIEFIFE